MAAPTQMSTQETSSRIAKLRKVVQLLSSSCENLIQEWEETQKRDRTSGQEKETELQSHAAYDAERTIKATLGSIQELTSTPSMRLMEFGTSYWNARALHIAAEHHIADLLAVRDEGVDIDSLARDSGVDKHKLSRIMRSLASEHIFCQVGPDRFANNVVSQALVDNEPLRAYIVLGGRHNYTASDHLPTTLVDPVAGPSYKVTETAFNRALGTKMTLYEWIAQKIPKSEPMKDFSPATGLHQQAILEKTVERGADEGEELVPRPEETIFNFAMIGGGKVNGNSHVYDFPWGELGKATLVDVGGGIGGFPMQLSTVYPELNFVVQDQAGMIDEAKQVWEKQQPDALSTGRTKLMVHDFWEVNPVKGAEVYWLRAVIHNWSDKYATDILARIAEVMTPESRLLIADQVMNTTIGDDALEPAPEPLLANYGRAMAYSHQRDLVMMALFNAVERTPAEFKKIVEDAGLRLTKVWQCRSQISIVECRLP